MNTVPREEMDLGPDAYTVTIPANAVEDVTQLRNGKTKIKLTSDQAERLAEYLGNVVNDE